MILEKGIILQNTLAGSLIRENTPDTHDEGAVIIERGIIVQKNQLAGGMILENSSRPDAGTVVHDGKLAGSVTIERGVILDDQHLAGGVISELPVTQRLIDFFPLFLKTAAFARRLRFSAF